MLLCVDKSVERDSFSASTKIEKTPKPIASQGVSFEREMGIEPPTFSLGS